MEPGAQVYACGPDRMIAALRELMTETPGALRSEHFASDGAALDPAARRASTSISSTPG